MQARIQATTPADRNAPSRTPAPEPPRVVVVGSGLEASFRRPQNPTERAARRLARGLFLPHRRIGEPWAPHGQLHQLQDAADGWLASLPLDPGHPLEEGGTWAEALGAWRQPTLLILPWQQLPSGAAASTLALLGQWRVPILGVLQWGGAWNPEQRRRDGLPWLGRLEESEGPDNEEATRMVTHLLLRQWSRLDHRWSSASGA